MRHFLALFFAIVLFGQPVEAEEPGVENVIRSQMQAFQADDMDMAFGFAADGIKRVFGSSERFGQMVRQGYPMVYRPGDVRFLELRELGGETWQKVLVRDQSGVVHLLDYQMIQTANGWRIGAVQLLRQAGAGA